MGEWDIAQVCVKGHAITDSLGRSPELGQDFCTRCGSKTITQCESCKTKIRGNLIVPGVVAVGFTYHPPKFCHKCGEPYPWTKNALKAANNLATEIENLNSKEKEILKQSFGELINDSPNTQVVALRVKKIMNKAGEASTAALKEIIIGFLTETAKKLVFG